MLCLRAAPIHRSTGARTAATDVLRHFVAQRYAGWAAFGPPFSANVFDAAPQNFAGETEAVAMSYRNSASGSKNTGLFNLYAYSFALDSSKTVQSVILPSDPDVVILAATLLQ